MQTSRERLTNRRTTYQINKTHDPDHLDDEQTDLSIKWMNSEEKAFPSRSSSTNYLQNDDRAQFENYQGIESTHHHKKNNTGYSQIEYHKPRPNDAYLTSRSDNLCAYRRKDFFLIFALGLLAAILRFKDIAHPSSVVFDEVHFGKFLSFYIKRQYFFDVHPPLAKLMLAFHAWLIGFNGEFEFENIGDDYIDGNVPYVGLRSFSAIIGSLIPILVYAIMKESGYPAFASTLSACMIVFDNAHILHTRLILLDGPLILFATCSLFAYIKFYKLRYNEFSKPWWIWLSLTGLSLSLTISCKLVGLFTFFTIGFVVALDLWRMLDIRQGHSLDHIGHHVLARLICLIIFPFCLYLFWFWVHFAILTHSGTGDDFMSAAFQQTLIDSPLTLAAEEIRYNDTLIMQHRASKCFLHSHLHTYPVKYPDDRVSSQGQQVTCYNHADRNNHWLVEPTKPIPDSGRGRIVRHHDVVRLKHVLTNSYLYTHDVASPSLPTNQEFTTWPDVSETDEAYNGTKWEIVIDDAHEGQQWKTKSSHFQLVHHITRAAMWTKSSLTLPAWGFGQQEVNGHKMYQDNTLLWSVSDIIRDNSTDHTSRPPPPQEKGVKKRSFIKKYFELQIAMFQYNAQLTESHPYASPPINWPFLLSGVSFWTSTPDLKQQIYMLGNPAGWWFCVMCLSVAAGVFGADQFARRRGYSPIVTPVRNRLYRSGGFFIIAWASHYFPFYLMSRQTFLHHYLPAHLFSTLVAGVVVNFVAIEAVNHPISILGPSTRRRPKMIAQDSFQEILIFFGFFLTILVGTFYFLAPLTYGTPGLSPDQVHLRQLLSTWNLHFAK